MEAGDFFTQVWPMIAAYPEAAITLAVVVGGGGFAVAWFLRENHMATLRERLALRDERIAQVESKAQAKDQPPGPKLNAGDGGRGGDGYLGGKGGDGGSIHPLPGGGTLFIGGQGGQGGSPPPSEVQAAMAQRSEALAQITQLYILSHDGISSRMMAGLELPPVDYINNELARQGALWRVEEITGGKAKTYDLSVGAPPSSQHVESHNQSGGITAHTVKKEAHDGE